MWWGLRPHIFGRRQGLRGFHFSVCQPRPIHSPPRGSEDSPQAAWGRAADPPAPKGFAFLFSISRSKVQTQKGRTGALLAFRVRTWGPGTQRPPGAQGSHYLGGQGPQVFQESFRLFAVPQSSLRLRYRSCGAALMPCGPEGFERVWYLEKARMRRVLT